MISRVRIVAREGEAPPLDAIRREFPSVEIFAAAAAEDDVLVDVAEWERTVDDFGPVDSRLREELAASPRGLAVRGEARAATRAAEEILTRYQRFVGRRNPSSRGEAWDAVLREHARLHDLAKPLVVADFDHALDVWQWVLRLQPAASAAVQMAALFHDVERLVSEADARVEHRAPDYQAFKDAHARAGAAMCEEALRRAGVDGPTRARAAELVRRHERRGGDEELLLLSDADALSFFSLNSPGYVDYFGEEQARRKVKWTLGRLGREQGWRLAAMRLRRDVRRMVEEAE